MSEELDLIAEFREDQGKGASRRLRHAGKVPAILYGAGRPPRLITLDHNKVLQQLEHESFYSSVLSIKVDNKVQAAIIKDVQRHPSKRRVLHMDFQRIVADEKIRMNVPIHFVGEDVAIGVKQGGGIISHLMSDVEVTCLPKHLPEFLTIDVSNLGLDEMIHLSGIELPEGVEIPMLAQGPDHDHAVVSIHRAKKVVEEDESAEAAEVVAQPQAEEKTEESGEE